MSKINDALNYLLPNGGWTIYDNDFATLIYDEGVKPITKKQYDDAFAVIEKINSAEAEAKATAKAALLERLGITQDEAKLLLS